MILAPRRLRLVAVALFVLLWGFTVWEVQSWPRELTFGGDALAYSNSAIHLLRSGFYSQDGIIPNTEREPGESLLLVVVYSLFGVENAVAAFAFHGLLFLLAAWIFTRELAHLVGERAADITLFMFAILPSIFRSVVSLNREALALSLFLFATTGVLVLSRRPSWSLALLIGLLFGLLSLTYVPFLLFPPFLAIVFWGLKIPQKYLIGVFLIFFLALMPWGIQNYQATGRVCVTGCHRTNIQWYVRGEMAEGLRGWEPIRCLWAEYISRDWTGRSPVCSFNGVMHRGWPDGLNLDERDLALGRQGRQKILQHFPWYLWYSLIEVLQLHLPYVDFWGRTYNLLSTVGTLFLYIGVFFSLPVVIWDRRFLLLGIPLGYTIGVFAVTDSVPRYFIPAIFCYVALAGVGYDWLLTWVSTRFLRASSSRSGS